MPSLLAMVGVSVVLGRLPGARPDGNASVSQNIWPRVVRQKPNSGTTGEFDNQPPLGVAEIMLP